MISYRLTKSTLPYKAQLEYMASLGLLSLADDGISLEAVKGERFKIALTEEKASVTYKQKADIFCGAFMLANKKQGFSDVFENRFELCGAMLDNSRNSVTNLKQLKEYTAYSAAFGLNCLYLYNEDTFEIEGEPYFGYMRDRYTAAEIKEIHDFAATFGVETVPCIQTLAHLNQALRWYCYAPITDMGDTMLADEEKTYELIEKMVAAWRSVCSTEHINIGMDEAHFLGRGKHLDKHGAEAKFDIMCRHLKRVAEICEKYGFKPMMWSDMFFRIAFGGYYSDEGIDPELLAKVPKNVTLAYWDYYSTDREKYIKQLDKHALFDNEIAFAGGAWKWSGFTPSINHSWKVSEIVLDEIKTRGVGKVMATCWGDDGAECLSATILPVLALYGAHRLKDGKEAARLAEENTLDACGYTVDEFFKLCRPSVTPAENLTPYANPTKYLFYNDPLKGMFDKHTTADFSKFYADCAEELKQLSTKDSRFRYLFDVQAKLCSVLELKATLGAELKAAYDKGDKAELKRLQEEVLPAIFSRTEGFYEAFRNGWMKESRPGGFDTQDIRIGGMQKRCLAAMRTVADYLAGKIDRIEELEQDRLYFDCRGEGSDKCLTIGYNNYKAIATSNIL
ncbi:MAG: beta-N-acetylhexosaminidase [Ruminococcaceae bacterium]|nr:beta-N-acetylhexosaminidase [Oscillospiraceae bacterium]